MLAEALFYYCPSCARKTCSKAWFDDEVFTWQQVYQLPQLLYFHLYHQLESFQTFTATLTQVQCRSFVSIKGLIPIQGRMVVFFRGLTHISHFSGRCRGKQEDNLAADPCHPCQCLTEHIFQLLEEREVKQCLMWCTEQAARAPQKAVLSVGWELWSRPGSALDALEPWGLFGVTAKPQQCTGTQDLCWGQPCVPHLLLQVLHDWK